MTYAANHIRNWRSNGLQFIQKAYLVTSDDRFSGHRIRQQLVVNEYSPGQTDQTGQCQRHKEMDM
jgi:hypothetical protein